MLDKSTLYTHIFSPSGYEEGLRDEIKKEVLPFADKVYVDNLGNLIAQKDGKGSKIVVSTNMDEPSIIAVCATEDGFIRVSILGTIDPLFCAGQKVTFLNGINGILIGEAEEGKCADISNLYVDIGAKSKEEAQKTVPSGTCAVFLVKHFNTGNNMSGRGVASRSACHILVETLKQLDTVENEMYFVFISKGRLPDAGVKSVVYGIDPKYYIALEILPSNDTPGGKAQKSPLGSGAYIKSQEDRLFCSKEINESILKAAEQSELKCQTYISKSGNSAVSNAQLVRNGVLSGSLAFPVRYLNTPFETVSQDDVLNAQKLLTATILSFRG